MVLLLRISWRKCPSWGHHLCSPLKSQVHYRLINKNLSKLTTVYYTPHVTGWYNPHTPTNQGFVHCSGVFEYWKALQHWMVVHCTEGSNIVGWPCNYLIVSLTTSPCCSLRWFCDQPFLCLFLKVSYFRKMENDLAPNRRWLQREHQNISALEIPTSSLSW